MSKSCTGVSGFCDVFFPSAYPLQSHISTLNSLKFLHHFTPLSSKRNHHRRCHCYCHHHKTAKGNVGATLHSLQVTLVYVISFNPYRSPMKYYYLQLIDEKARTQQNTGFWEVVTCPKFLTQKGPGIQVTPNREM